MENLREIAETRRTEAQESNSPNSGFDEALG